MVRRDDGVADWPCPPSQVGEWWWRRLFDIPAFTFRPDYESPLRLGCPVSEVVCYWGDLKNHDGHGGSSSKRSLLKTIMDCWTQVGAFYSVLFLKTVSLDPLEHVRVCWVCPPSWMPGFWAELGGFLGSVRIYQQDPTHCWENGHLQDPTPRGKYTHNCKDWLQVLVVLPVRLCSLIWACLNSLIANNTNGTSCHYPNRGQIRLNLFALSYTYFLTLVALALF